MCRNVYAELAEGVWGAYEGVAEGGGAGERGLGGTEVTGRWAGRGGGGAESLEIVSLSD